MCMLYSRGLNSKTIIKYNILISETYCNCIQTQYSYTGTFYIAGIEKQGQYLGLKDMYCAFSICCTWDSGNMV